MRHGVEVIQCVRVRRRIGTIVLEDGVSVKGFLCESAAVRSGRFGGWVSYLQEQQSVRV